MISESSFCIRIAARLGALQRRNGNGDGPAREIAVKRAQFVILSPTVGAAFTYVADHDHIGYIMLALGKKIPSEDRHRGNSRSPRWPVRAWNVPMQCHCGQATIKITAIGPQTTRGAVQYKYNTKDLQLLYKDGTVCVCQILRSTL